jgi:hypothetical protein
MSYTAVARLLARWLDEPAFRAELCADPEGTARRHGFELTDEEWAALRHFDWTASEEDSAPNSPGGPTVMSWTVWLSGSLK